MKLVSKYNTFKIISTLLTIGAPVITAFSCSDFIVKSSNASISTAGVVAVLLSALFLKDKIAEQFKAPTVLKITSVLLVIILLVKAIIEPVLAVLIATEIVCVIDELSFKRIYKTTEKLLPETSEAYKHFGFIFCKTSTIVKEESEI